ncbi:unnamed protein product [Arctia plantaginis]|uniref:Uncharacterized protein n=1 Tax=Arctia plantaginis TaxID=874455 RepID=A0A8S0ZE85_ARCPL|nr:unnamed protein product [Arctia plantaginis]CAB3250125.1 unnamed protein product [Arctia plantaginis]
MNLFAESVVQSCAGFGWWYGTVRAVRALGLSACAEPLIAGNDEPTAEHPAPHACAPPAHTIQYTDIGALVY